MGRFLFLFSISMYLFTSGYAQVSPLSLSPKWYFGVKAGLDFTSGGIPLVLNDGKIAGWAQEGSTSIVDKNKNVVFYSNGYELYDGVHNFKQIVRGGTSSVQNGIAIPDPGNTSRYYLFTANVDPWGGGQRVASSAQLGINYYHIEKTATGINIIGGPVQLATYNEVTEQLTSGIDGDGNYWIVAHQGGDFSGWQMRNIYSWHVTASGVGTRNISSVAGTTGNCVWQGSLKINKCQNRLGAVYSTGVVEVYDWDMNTGKVTGLVIRKTGFPSLYGCEFSPNGNILYFTSHSDNIMYQLNIETGDVYSEAAWRSMNNVNWMGTLQLGPDNKVYVTNGNDAGAAGSTPSYLGVVNNPDIPGAGCNYDGMGFLLNPGPDVFPNIDRGIANIAWLSPNKNMFVGGSCPNFSFSYEMKSYFNEDVTILPGSEEWDFGDGSGFRSGLGIAPEYSFSTAGNFNVRLKFKDQTCNNTWTINRSINIDCILPVTWLDIMAEYESGKSIISWRTSSELNNKYFVVERSFDGELFEEIASLDGSGNSNSVKSYKYYDQLSVYGKMYYRIKQVDFNGTESFSKVVTVINEQNSIIAYPNPSEDNFRISWMSENDAYGYVSDAVGKLIFEGDIFDGVSIGENWPSGIYHLKVISDEIVYSMKLYKN
ncbi:MAG: hypothetical protein ACK40G_09445 [Cytophagaceae bacterium]